MIENIKKEKPHALLNKSCVFHFPKGKLNWNKQLFEREFKSSFDAMRKKENGDMINGLHKKSIKEQWIWWEHWKTTYDNNNSKKVEEPKYFSFPILDTSIEKKTKIDLFYKMLFFYIIWAFAKDVLNYVDKED